MTKIELSQDEKILLEKLKDYLIKNSRAFYSTNPSINYLINKTFKITKKYDEYTLNGRRVSTSFGYHLWIFCEELSDKIKDNEKKITKQRQEEEIIKNVKELLKEFEEINE